MEVTEEELERVEAMEEQLVWAEVTGEELARAEAMEEEVVAWPEVMEVGLADRSAATVILADPVEVMV